MKTSSDKDIVTAEVVEVPKPERPELWVAIGFDERTDDWVGSVPMVDRDDAEGNLIVCAGVQPRCVIRIPGSTPQPQPAAPEADDGLQQVADYLHTAQEYIRSERWDGVMIAVASAAACLAKIRGGR